MYSLRYSKTYGFEIMEKNNLKQVLEDKFYADEKIFCIADGVTRDYTDGTFFQYPTTLEEAKKMLEKYPNPSGAAMAAEICVHDVEDYLNKFDEKGITTKILKNAIEISNNNIKKLNKGRNLNYTSEDEYCCVAIGGFFADEELYCFSIGDSGIVVCDEDYNIIFNSLTYVKDDYGLFLKAGKKIMPNLFNYKKKWYRKYLRKYIRNNIWLKKANIRNLGVLNGEKKAMEFLMTFRVSLKNAKYVLAFSDGCIESIDTKEKLKQVIQKPQIISETTPEKTLIIYEKINANID